MVVDTAADAGSATPHTFRITHLTESSSTAEDTKNDAPLQMQFAPNTPSAVITILPGTTDPPGRTQLTGPIPHVGDATPTITWAESSDSDEYQLLVYSQTRGQALINVILPGTEAVLSTNMPSDIYEAYVRGINGNGFAPWSEPFIFTVSPSAAATTPMIHGPVSDILDTTPVIAWSEVTSAMDYDVLVYSVDRGAEVAAGTNISGTHFTTTELPTGETYVAYVRANLSNGTRTSWSPRHRFAIHSPVSPRFILPGSVAESPAPTFVWTGVDSAVDYELLIYNVTTGQEVRNIAGITSTSYTLANSLHRTTHQAFVRTRSADGVGPWSAPLNFEVTASNLEPHDTDENLTNLDDANPEAIVETIEVAEEPRLKKAHFQPSEIVEDIAQLDAALENWAETEWWSDSVHPQIDLEVEKTSKFRLAGAIGLLASTLRVFASRKTRHRVL